MRKSKQPKTFRDETGEACCPASLVASALMVISSIVGTIALIGLIWFSRCFAQFLKTGGWTWL
jgi:hypothetical protein